MTPPTIELLPLRPAVRSDAATTLDVLVRITPPAVEVNRARPTLNLGLVIDRSGSMAEANKITFARDAAAFAVKELAPTDRVSLTVFDDRIDTLAPNTLAADRDRLLRLIAGVEPRGSTALHGGWAEGAKQVGDHLVPGGLNRVLLLSDGLANVGEARPDVIATDVHARLAGGVGTTTLGLGNQYNEDLLEAMARAGDGNYYYVESPAQLAAIFHAELHGLAATVGTDVLLAVEPGPGVTVLDVLNDLDRTADGRLKLPNLVSGFPVLGGVTLRGAGGGGRAAGVRRAARLDRTGRGRPRDRNGPASRCRRSPPRAGTRSRPTSTCRSKWCCYLSSATRRPRRRRWNAMTRKKPAAASPKPVRYWALIPPTAEVGIEIQAVAEIDAQIERGDFLGSVKRAKHEAYSRRHSKPYLRPDDTQ